MRAEPTSEQRYNQIVPALIPITHILLSLPHPLEFFWVIWFFAMLFQINYLFKQRNTSGQLQKSGEIMNFREVTAVGCIAGFILLTFITAFCTYLVMKTKGLIG